MKSRTSPRSEASFPWATPQLPWSVVATLVGLIPLSYTRPSRGRKHFEVQQSTRPENPRIWGDLPRADRPLGGAEADQASWRREARCSRDNVTHDPPPTNALENEHERARCAFSDLPRTSRREG